MDVDTKKFEFAVLRSLGLDKKGVINLILTQTIIFVVPALILGELLSWFFLIIISKEFKEKLDINMKSLPQGYSLIFSLTIGILIPIISSLIPIRQALKQNLNNSLRQI